MNKRAVIITPTGEKSVVEFNKDTAYGIFRTALDGYVQVVPLPFEGKEIDLWVNEDGKFRGDLEFNPIATRLWEQAYGQTDYIVGTAVFTNGTDRHGHTLGLTKEQVDALLAL